MVTGAAGRIGRAVVAALAARGTAVHALILESAAVAGSDEIFVGSAADPAAVRAAMRGVDGVVHLAAKPAPHHGTPLEVFGGNVSATFAVLEEAGRAGVRHAVIASSYAATGLPFARKLLHPAYVPIDVDLPAQAEDPYALSKQADELTAAMMARRHGMSVVALRYPFVGGVQERLPEHAAAIAADPGLGARDLWAYLDLRDAAEAAVLALGVDEPGAHVVYVAAPQTISPLPTEELLDRYHPHVPRRAPLPGRTVPIDLAPAQRLFGFRARHEFL
ncbi:MAG: NAD(P)-dependent oxidoreductase [Hamadaea sp.]|nr:NAD(P)-dependent oxidoreductase [Hamadaea sp.]